jgi:adenylate cyclase
MSEENDQAAMVENVWRTFLTTGELVQVVRQRRLFRMLPGSPRCNNCYAPFKGLGAPIARIFFGKRPANMNPRVCNVCEAFAREYKGGAEVELSLLFADVRGSTALAESMSATEFSRIIDRFYNAASQALVANFALIDKIIGDQASGIFVPGYTGPEHAQAALAAARALMKATGHGRAKGAWIPLGVGVHSGVAFVGAIGSDTGTMDITVLGDAANTAARLSSAAGPGEILISEAAARHASLDVSSMERRELTLKGKSESVTVYVLADGSA